MVKSTPDMARLKSLKVAVKLFPLLRGGLEIDSFVLEEPQIVLEIDRQGRVNLSRKAAMQRHLAKEQG